ncbi:MAG TPA: hypothetical protein VL651_06805 [Bacteroidia bacterium]|jgi:hypothetical protein|nr:hypothetical protein [Bacteroidia bacterium]
MANYIVGVLLLLAAIGIGFLVIRDLKKEHWSGKAWVENGKRIIVVVGFLLAGTLFLLGVMNVADAK